MTVVGVFLTPFFAFLLEVLWFICNSIILIYHPHYMYSDAVKSGAIPEQQSTPMEEGLLPAGLAVDIPVPPEATDLILPAGGRFLPVGSATPVRDETGESAPMVVDDSLYDILDDSLSGDSVEADADTVFGKPPSNPLNPFRKGAHRYEGLMEMYVADAAEFRNATPDNPSRFKTYGQVLGRLWAHQTKRDHGLWEIPPLYGKQIPPHTSTERRLGYDVYYTPDAMVEFPYYATTIPGTRSEHRTFPRPEEVPALVTPVARMPNAQLLNRHHVYAITRRPRVDYALVSCHRGVARRESVVLHPDSYPKEGEYVLLPPPRHCAGP